MNDGVLIINKEKGLTSRDVVNKVCKILNTKKVGHCGTLDPLATGVLVLGINNGLKIIRMLNSDTKEYIAEAQLGLQTDTLDITGKIIKEEHKKVDIEKLKEIIKSFECEYLQEVPIYSSVKVNGERLYKYARENKEVDLPKRMVKIYNIEIIEITDNSFKFKAKVSKGTYIRSLIRDIGEKLNIPCTMSNLERVKEGIFDIKDSYTLDQIEKGNYKLISFEDALKNYFQVNIDKELEEKILDGKILDNIYNKEIVIFKNNKRVIAIYEKYSKDLTKIKPLRVFK